MYFLESRVVGKSWNFQTVNSNSTLIWKDLKCLLRSLFFENHVLYWNLSGQAFHVLMVNVFQVSFQVRLLLEFFQANWTLEHAGDSLLMYSQNMSIQASLSFENLSTKVAIKSYSSMISMDVHVPASSGFEIFTTPFTWKSFSFGVNGFYVTSHIWRSWKGFSTNVTFIFCVLQTSVIRRNFVNLK